MGSAEGTERDTLAACLFLSPKVERTWQPARSGMTLGGSNRGSGTMDYIQGNLKCDKCTRRGPNIGTALCWMGIPSEISSCRRLVSLEAIPARLKHPLAPNKALSRRCWLGLEMPMMIAQHPVSSCPPWPSRRCHVSYDNGGLRGLLNWGWRARRCSGFQQREMPTRISGFLAIPNAVSQEPINRPPTGDHTFSRAPGPPCVRVSAAAASLPARCLVADCIGILRCYKTGWPCAVSCSWCSWSAPPLDAPHDDVQIKATRIRVSGADPVS